MILVLVKRRYLILAYNRDAATSYPNAYKNIAREANLDLENSPSISTFHALGRRIIKNVEISPLVKFAEDPMKLDRWFNKWLEDYIKEDPDNLAEIHSTCIPTYLIHSNSKRKTNAIDM